MKLQDIHYASPTGSAIALSFGGERAYMPSHGMYRAEIDVKKWAAKGDVSDLLLEVLSGIRSDEKVLVMINDGLDIKLDKSFIFLRKSKGCSVYLASNEISGAVLGALTNLPYGDIALVGIAPSLDVTVQLPTLVDLDDALKFFGEKASWGVGYYESAILTLLSRRKEVVKKHILKIIEMRLDTLS